MRPLTENTELLPYDQLATRQWLLEQGVEAYQIDNALNQKGQTKLVLTDS